MCVPQFLSFSPKNLNSLKDENVSVKVSVSDRFLQVSFDGELMFLHCFQPRMESRREIAGSWPLIANVLEGSKVLEIRGLLLCCFVFQNTDLGV